MSRKTTGSNGNNLEGRLNKAIESVHVPTKREIEAKAKFHHRIKNGPFAGTPVEDYSRELINRVLGYELPLNAAAYVWFKNEDEFEEMKKASLEGAIGVIAEIMHDKSAPAPARLKAAELALKVSKAFDKKDEGKKPESSAFSDAEIESMKAQGIDVTPFLKEVK